MIDVAEKGEYRFPVYHIFSSIQGEATWTGRATLFIRFSGCPLSCPWCDEPLHKDPQAARSLTAEEILQELRRVDPSLSCLVLTGGEPLAVNNLPWLVQFFKKRGFWLAMETSGVGGPIPPGVDWITLSPKKPLPDSLFAIANEIKYIVGASPTTQQVAEIQQRAKSHANVWVQPQSRHDTTAIHSAALQRCLEQIKQSNGKIRLSLQTHKLVDLP